MVIANLVYRQVLNDKKFVKDLCPKLYANLSSYYFTHINNDVLYFSLQKIFTIYKIIFYMKTEKNLSSLTLYNQWQQLIDWKVLTRKA